ncbi:MAG TPA: PRC-barrel domain-containing protein, partial [Kofleriaceae bacterium]|nr:PRC-barrel domain-containing protein [Kofleriaceae bacterium]
GLIAVIERPGGGFVALPFNQLTTMGNLSPPSSAAPAGQPITMGAPGPADSTVGIDKLVFLGGQQSLSTAPVLQQPNQMDPSWLQRFHEHFGTNAIGAPPLGGPGEPAIGATGMPPAGRVGEGPVFLGNFLSSGIEDGRGQRLGSVKDVAISLPDGRVAFAVVSTPGADRGSAEVLHGVPFESFQQGVPGTLLLPATPTMFGTSSGLDLNHLPRQPDVNVAVPAMPPRAQPMGPAPNQPGNEPMKPPQKPGAGQAGNPPPNKPENPPAPKPGPKPAPTGPKSSHS